MHLGMTGWVKLSNESTYYKSGPENDEEGGEEVSDASVGSEKTAKRRGKGRHEEWPPRFMKFVLKMEGEPEVEAAFVDGRRLARIRLIDCAADQMRKMTPLKENGPDPVQDKDVLTVEWLGERMRKKKVPVKAFLLDQANISGVGNWVSCRAISEMSWFSYSFAYRWPMRCYIMHDCIRSNTRIPSATSRFDSCIGV